MASRKPTGAAQSGKPAASAAKRRKPAAKKADPVVLDPPKSTPSQAAKDPDTIDAKAVDVTPTAKAAAPADAGKATTEPAPGAPAQKPSGDAGDQSAQKVPPVQPEPGPVRPQGSASRIGAMVAGGALAAVIGYLAHDVISPPPTLPDSSAEIARLAAESRSAAEEQASVIAALDARIAELEAARAASPVAKAEADVAALKAEIEARATELAGRLDASEARVVEILGELEASRSRITATFGSAGDDIGAEVSSLLETYGAEIENLKSQLAAQMSDSASLSARLDQVAASAGEKLDAARATISDMTEKASAAARDVDLSLAHARLKAAVETGKSYAAILGEVAEKAAADIPEALLKSADEGVASLPELQADFPAAARSALKASIRAEAGEGTGERLFAFLKSQLGARSLEERAGDDPDAILSQAEAALGRGELAASVYLVKRLPAAGVVEMSGWLVRAEARLVVEAALEEFAKPSVSE